MDIVTERIRSYNVCRAKTRASAKGEHRNGGVAFPAKRWKKTGIGGFIVLVTGQYLRKRDIRTQVTRTL
eukprot:9054009-Prorocentrum_lima.AAC.1